MNTKPNLMMITGLVDKSTLNRLLAGWKLKQKKAYKRVALQLRKELWDTEETHLILEAIKPEIKPIKNPKQ